MKLDIRRSVLNILPAASTDNTRRALTGVCFRNGNALACNGHVLAALRHETPECGELLVGAEELQRAFKLAHKHASAIAAEQRDGHVELDFGSGTVRSTLCDMYPTVEHVIPHGESSWEVTFGVEVLTALVAIAKKAKENKITFRFLGDRDSTSPVLYAFGDGNEYKGLVGPHRRATRDHTVSFLGEKCEEAKSAAA